ncbi:MAG TPA: LacI family DNA-binding transcriptional regulator [Anaerolineales bacterium]|nr:LacI family DNA-binding transcriptional regulator [Anaerolineales bacterium]
MAHKRRVTIKEVAEAAGVSTQTVSRVVNNHPDVATETFQRVQQVIKETGYAPNALARSLIRGRSHTLGVVAYGLDYFGPSRVLTGIEQQANELGYSIFLNLLHQPEMNDVDHLLDSLLARQVDGIIWAIPEIGDNRAWARAKSPELPIPIMFVSGMGGSTSLPLVGVENRAIGRLATEHLLAGGARRIGIITGPLSWWEAKERQQGWRETLEARGLTAEDWLVAMGDWTAKSGEQGLYQLLAQRPDIDGVFVSNDQMALGVLHAAHRLGRRVPDDISIIGVDNIPESAHFWPPLTTVRQRLREAGAQAVTELDQTIQKSKQSQRNWDVTFPKVALLQPELIVRESSRPSASSPQ